MEWLVEFEPSIEPQLIVAMDKELEKSANTQRKGVKLLEKKVKLPTGQEVVIGKGINDKINQQLAFVFNYEMLETGKMKIIFKSMADKIPLINKFAEKTMTHNLKTQLRKEFGSKILSIKVLK